MPDSCPTAQRPSGPSSSNKPRLQWIQHRPPREVALRISQAQAHGDLLDLSIEQRPYELLGSRVWAELAGAPLVTLDRRIGRAPGLRCEVKCPR
ncbi:hypothetical protein B1964_28195 [Gordonia sp. i37]|nr:hypothetical protein B1964_28195 [Gordonia sp. i37]